jgi:hypothetical protein
MPEAIAISQSSTDMLQKLWNKFTAVQQKAQQEHQIFMEFLEYLQKELRVPQGYVLANDVRSFVPSPQPAPVVVEPEVVDSPDKKAEDAAAQAVPKDDAPVAPELTDKNINEFKE